MTSNDTLQRIHAALEAAREVLNRFTPGAIEAQYKVGTDPVTEADRAVDEVLKKNLLRDGEGWLSEETVDDFSRLDKQRVWVVDPLDGTREFVQGIPEFCVSIAMVENGIPVAGGICNPATDELILGSRETGVTYNGQPAQPSQRKDLHGALVLASRSEVKRGEWKQFESAEFNIRPMGSVAYKLGLVAAGRADLTFTLVPKNEWDVAAGAALVESAGGFILTLDHTPLRCNRKNPLLSGLLGGGPHLRAPLLELLERQDAARGRRKTELDWSELMAPARIVFLMYHELELPDRKLVQSEPGYVRYILHAKDFRNQMEWLKTSGFRGLSVSEALLYPAAPSVCLTFDDGCETDLIAAAPILQEFGFRATFYLTSGFLGKPGYLNPDQVRNLDSLGFEIGCHSMTHPYLSDLTDAELGGEIIDAKLQIEQILGHAISHFSCPGGRYDQRTLETARRAGFRTVANSRFQANSHATGQYELGRVAMLRDAPLIAFAATCQGRGLWKKRLPDQTRQGIRRLLGNRVYDRVRSAVLGEQSQ